MTTRATATLQGIADVWEGMYGSALFSGIVGDVAHEQRGGYHISIIDQSDPGNYSVVRPDDKAPPGTWPRDCASAIDMNLGLADMKVCHARLVAVWRNRASDPRARYINAHNGWNGEGNAGRYDWVTGGVYAASDDHKWHCHLEVRRRYVNDPKAAEAIVSILSGQSLSDYLGDDDMFCKQGDTGEKVKALQYMLRLCGRTEVTVDGDYGPATTAAVAALVGQTNGETYGPWAYARLHQVLASKGPKGDPGPAGPAGPKGDKGDPGTGLEPGSQFLLSATVAQ